MLLQFGTRKKFKFLFFYLNILSQNGVVRLTISSAAEYGSCGTICQAFWFLWVVRNSVTLSLHLDSGPISWSTIQSRLRSVLPAAYGWYALCHHALPPCIRYLAEGRGGGATHGPHAGPHAKQKIDGGFGQAPHTSGRFRLFGFLSRRMLCNGLK